MPTFPGIDAVSWLEDTSLLLLLLLVLCDELRDPTRGEPENCREFELDNVNLVKRRAK